MSVCALCVRRVHCVCVDACVQRAAIVCVCLSTPPPQRSMEKTPNEMQRLCLSPSSSTFSNMWGGRGDGLIAKAIDPPDM